MSISIRQIHKHYGTFHALKGIDLDIASGELLALLGPSGCGKTTLLRTIAGLETADSGSIALSGKEATDLDVRERQVGFVFQHYALFRHMTVFDNVAFGLTVKPRKLRPSKEAIRDKVMGLLQLVQLDWLADRYPAQLSGGQRQRIALARALAVEPQVLLLDEPFGALDAQVRKELRRWLRRLHDELHITSIFVTHDQEEALEVADRVVLMNAGAIEQIGTPQEVWAQPATPFVYSFLGNVNRFAARAHQGQVQIGTPSSAHTSAADDPGHQFAIAAPEHAAAEQRDAHAFVRPHELHVQPWRAGEAGIAATITRALCIGPTARLELTPLHGEGILEAEMPNAEWLSLALKEGDRVLAKAQTARVFVMQGADI